MDDETQKPAPPRFPRWATFMIIFLILGIALGVAGYFIYKRRTTGMNLQGAPIAPNAGAMPGPTNAGLNSGAGAPAGNMRLATNRV